MAAQPAGVALGVGQLLPWGAGALGVQPSQGLPEHSQAAAASVAIKANAGLAAELWRSLAGPKYFLARGSFSVAEDLSPDLLRLILKRIAGVSVACTNQLQGLSDFAVGCPPPGPGRGAPARHAGGVFSHFHRRIYGRTRIRHGERPGALHAERCKPAERYVGGTGVRAGAPTIPLYGRRITPKASSRRAPPSYQPRSRRVHARARLASRRTGEATPPRAASLRLQGPGGAPRVREAESAAGGGFREQPRGALSPLGENNIDKSSRRN